MIIAPLAHSTGRRRPAAAPAGQQRFLVMLPAIRRIARFAFRRLPRQQRDDGIDEVIAASFVAYAKLLELGKQDLAYPTPLAWYGIAQYRSGRRVGGRVNSRDLGSIACQRRYGVVVQSLVGRNEQGGWEDLLIEDRNSTPAEIAVARIDFKSWLRRLDRRRRAAARLLAGGTTTSEAAKELGVSSARVSQLRSELRADWDEFQHEPGQLVAA